MFVLLLFLKSSWLFVNSSLRKPTPNHHNIVLKRFISSYHNHTATIQIIKERRYHKHHRSSIFDLQSHFLDYEGNKCIQSTNFN
jgi:hypothetical protein